MANVVDGEPRNSREWSGRYLDEDGIVADILKRVAAVIDCQNGAHLSLSRASALHSPGHYAAGGWMPSGLAMGNSRTHSSITYSGMLSNLCGLSCIKYSFSM